MKNIYQRLITGILLLPAFVFLQQASAQTTANDQARKGSAPQELYNEIAHMDSVLFNAYNTQDLEKMKTLFTEDLEFYHDLGGLTNYEQNIVAFKTNFEKKMGIHRELVPGTLEVYAVKDYGAMEIGAHRFCHKEYDKDDCGTYRFVMIWRKKDGQWKISRVVSYGH